MLNLVEEDSRHGLGSPLARSIGAGLLQAHLAARFADPGERRRASAARSARWTVDRLIGESDPSFV